MAVLAGLTGMLVDSVLGATIQARYRCNQCGRVSEQAEHAACAAQSSLEKGLAGIDNDVVNALATLAGGAVGIALTGVA